MANSIETLLEMLTGDSQKATEFKGMLKSFSENKEFQDLQNKPETSPNENNKLQQKINLINAMIPLLNGNGAEYAQFVIRLLSMLSVLQQLKNSQN